MFSRVLPHLCLQTSDLQNKSQSVSQSVGVSVRVLDQKKRSNSSPVSTLEKQLNDWTWYTRTCGSKKVTLVNFFFISSELLAMPAVKRFSVSFAKHPTNGTSASFKYFFHFTSLCLACLQTFIFETWEFFFSPHGPSAFQVFCLHFFSNWLLIWFILLFLFYILFCTHTLWILTFLTLSDILFLTRVPTCETSRC